MRDLDKFTYHDRQEMIRDLLAYDIFETGKVSQKDAYALADFAKVVYLDDEINLTAGFGEYAYEIGVMLDEGSNVEEILKTDPDVIIDKIAERIN